MSTAVTASVWGQGLAAIKLSAQVASRGMREGDEECHICRDDIPATIAFVPCKHKVCFGCMENMRAKNIFKADKGIKCPFCRQYVDGYRSVHQATTEIQAFLFEANKAAAVAAQARAAAERRANTQQQQQQPAQAAGASSGRQQQAASNNMSGGSSNADGDQVWNCGSCGERNYFWREFCGRCKRPCPTPYAADKLSQTRKDLAQVSRGELVQYLHDQGGFVMRKALKDMGVSLDTQKSYGSTACVRDAVAFFGLKRVLHVVDLLSDPATLQTASLHHMGNLGVQRVMEGVVKLRAAYGPGTGKPQHPDVEAFINSHGGRDPFGSMLAALNSRMLQFCMNDKGVYVAQCAAAVASTAELVEMAQAAFPLTLVVSRDPRGVFVLLTLLDLLSARIWDDTQACEPGLQAIDLLCQQYTLSDKQLVHNAMHALSGKVMVRAIAISMPRLPALKLAVKIACHASQLWPTSGGQFTLSELLQLYGHNKEAAEGLRDVVACICYSTQGQIARMALGSDANVHELLLSLVERLGHEQEVGWLDALTQEMVGVLDQLLGSPTGLEILKFTMTQPCLDLDTVTSHIGDMKSVLSKSQLLPLVGDLMERVSSNPPPPAPKYPAASTIQPELRYFLTQGYPTPLPPPPPPRPGDAGYEAYLAAAAARAEAQATAAAEARANREAEAAARREAAAAADTNGHGGSTRSTAVIDAWSRLQAGADGGSSGNSSSNPWDLSSSTVDAAEPSAAGSSDPWAAVTGGGSGSDWGAVTATAPAASADPWGLPIAAMPAPAPASSNRAVAPVAVPVAVPVAAPVARPVAAPVAAPVTQPVAAPVAAPVARPVAAPVAAPVAVAVPVAVPVVAPVVAPMPAQQYRAGGFGGNPAARAMPAQPPPAPPAAVAAVTPHASTAGLVQDPAWPAPQQAGQMGSRSRSITPSQQQQRPASARRQQPQQQRPQALPVQQQQPEWEAVPAAAAAVEVDGPWACQVCTYEHTGAECKFLSCAICGTPKHG